MFRHPARNPNERRTSWGLRGAPAFVVARQRPIVFTPLPPPQTVRCTPLPLSHAPGGALQVHVVVVVLLLKLIRHRGRAEAGRLGHRAATPGRRAAPLRAGAPFGRRAVDLALQAGRQGGSSATSARSMGAGGAHASNVLRTSRRLTFAERNRTGGLRKSFHAWRELKSCGGRGAGFLSAAGRRFGSAPSGQAGLVGARTLGCVRCVDAAVLPVPPAPPLTEAEPLLARLPDFRHCALALQAVRHRPSMGGRVGIGVGASHAEISQQCSKRKVPVKLCEPCAHTAVV